MGGAEEELRLLEQIRAIEARSRGVALEILGDIDNADEKPAENVLFVCKLNPYTVAEDLETIFAQFGKILSCEIVYDFKTGDSLQYGFVEFETEAACREAYFKMQGALIDDRRIHVNFCQSTARRIRSRQNPSSHRRRGKGESSELDGCASSPSEKRRGDWERRGEWQRRGDSQRKSHSESGPYSSSNHRERQKSRAPQVRSIDRHEEYRRPKS